MTIILDKLHEELTDIYVSNEKKKDEVATNGSAHVDWNETSQTKNKMVKDHQQYQ